MKRIKRDKCLHFGVCFVVSLLAGGISISLGGECLVSAIEGVMVAMAAGAGKEFGDKMHGGKWDWGDMVADLAGAIAGAYVLLLANLAV